MHVPWMKDKNSVTKVILHYFFNNFIKLSDCVSSFKSRVELWFDENHFVGFRIDLKQRLRVRVEQNAIYSVFH